MSVEGQDERARAWERFMGLTHPDVTALLSHGPMVERAHGFGFDAGRRAALVESEARERERLDMDYPLSCGACRWAIPRADLTPGVRCVICPRCGAAEVASEERHLRRKTEAREAVLVEALRGLLDAVGGVIHYSGPSGAGRIALPSHKREAWTHLEALARSASRLPALAEVVEAEPTPNSSKSVQAFGTGVEAEPDA